MTEQVSPSAVPWLTVLECSARGIVITEPGGDYEVVYANPAFEKLTGYAASEIVGRNCRFLQGPDTDSAARAEIRAALRDGRACAVTLLNYRKDGTPFWSEVAISPAREASGRLLCFVGLQTDVTARVLEALRTEGILRTALDGFWIADGRGRFLDVNQAYCDLVGYSREELLGMSIANLEALEDSGQVTEHIARVAEVGHDRFETRHRAKDGTLLDIEVSATFLPQPRGEGQFVVFLRDVTARNRAAAVLKRAHDTLEERVLERTLELERANAALKQRDQRLRVALASVDMAVFEQDAELRYQWMFAPQLGYQVEQVVGRTDAELLPPVSAAHITTIKRRVLDTGLPTREIVSVDGDQPRQFDLVVEPIRGADGSIVGVAGASLDVTDRRRSQQALRESEERLAQLSRAVEQSPASILITDLDGRIEYVNPKFLEVTGYAATEVLGRNPSLLKGGKTPPEVYAELWSTISAGKEWRGELCNKRKDGAEFWELASISPITDGEGRTTHYLAIKEEITGRKLAEAERARMESELRQASKMEAVGQLAGGVAHDFNNMLAVILSYADVARAGLDAQDPLRQDLEEILSAARRSADLTQQLLAFSRRQAVVPQVLDLNDAISGQQGMITRLIGEDIALSVSFAPGLWNVRVDPGQIAQVLINLAVNARDAIANGGQIVIETANVVWSTDDPARPVDLAPGEYVRLSVRDTGVGMDPATLERIFEPFFTTKPEGRGTGLGLSTVYGIVKQNEGLIQVSSTRGQGTAFTVHLPRSVGERPTARPRTSRPASGGCETILVVEDEPQLLRLARRVLESAGYRVITAQTPDEACRIAEDRAGEIDLLLSDVVMPGMSGKQIQERIEGLNPRLRTVLMSGYPADIVSERGVVEADASFLAKPFSPEALVRKIRETLEN